MDDDVKDPLEAMDEEDEEEEDGMLLDPKKLKKKGLHIEGEDDLIDPDIAVNPLLEKDSLVDDEGLPLVDEDEEVEDELFKDKEEW